MVLGFGGELFSLFLLPSLLHGRLEIDTGFAVVNAHGDVISGLYCMGGFVTDTGPAVVCAGCARVSVLSTHQIHPYGRC